MAIHTLWLAARAENIGLGMAKGELIAFIDSDDLWAATKLEKQVEAMKKYPEAKVILTMRDPGTPREVASPLPGGDIGTRG